MVIMERIIFRVDDRLIHGQVLEGWINYLRIKNILIVNDDIALDKKRAFIYQSVMPTFTNLKTLSIESFLNIDILKKYKKGYLLVILNSINDLKRILSNIPKTDSYINLGCLSNNRENIYITDNCFINKDDLESLLYISLSLNRSIFAHKLPQEKVVDICDLLR